MINTRIYDRAPLKDVRVKEPQVGRVRTPQILMSRTNEGYQKGDILDANTTAILIKNLHSPDIERLQEQIEEARRKLADAVMKDSVGAPGGVASLDGNGNIPTSQLGNVDVDIFMIVNELPTENIKNNKIYCVKDTTSTDENNTYIEYAYINNAWEKVGQFQAEPNLSGYAKLSGAQFRGYVYFMEGASFHRNVKIKSGSLYDSVLEGCRVMKTGDGYLNAVGEYNVNDSRFVFAANGSLFDTKKLLLKSDYQTDKANLDTAIENVNTAISTEQQERENADTELRSDFDTLSRNVSSMINYMGQMVNSNSISIVSIRDKITPKTELNLTSIDTADIESLRSIVKALATELNTRGLIKLKSA